MQILLYTEAKNIYSFKNSGTSILAWFRNDIRTHASGNEGEEVGITGFRLPDRGKFTNTYASSDNGTRMIYLFNCKYVCHKK